MFHFCSDLKDRCSGGWQLGASVQQPAHSTNTSTLSLEYDNDFTDVDNVWRFVIIFNLVVL